MNLARPQWKMLQQRLPHLMTALIVIQPALDVLSFWLNAAGMGNALTLALRCALLVAVFLLGFALAEKRRRYLILAAVLVAFAVCHAAAVLQADAMTLPSEGEATGLGALLSDLINYVRVAQIPVFTFCFITFLKRSGEAGLQAIKKGFLIALLLIAAVEVLSVLTGTDPHTYAAKDIGVLGWFYGTNAQSAILCILIPVSIMTVIQKSARMLPQIALCVLGFGMLYLFGTRLAYAAIFATAVGLAFTLFVADREKRRSIVLLLVCAAVCLGGFFQSPMYENRSVMTLNAADKQERIDTLVAGSAAWAEAYGLEGETYERVRLLGAYHAYLSGLVEKYGIARVAELYDYTTDGALIADNRIEKQSYCILMLEDSPPLSRLFGLELGDMVYRDTNYDLENDFLGIYRLYGAVGALLLGGFFLYFIGLIGYALLKNAKKYYTTEAGAWGVALVMALLHAYATAGILRRPNASFYLSVVLAVIFFLVLLRRYDNSTKTPPDGDTGSTERMRAL